MEILFLIGRVLFGLFFLISGLNHFLKIEGMIAYARSKKIPQPKFAVAFTGLMLLFSGTGIFLGIYTQLSLVLISIFLFFVSITMHDFWNDKDPSIKQGNVTNFMKNVALLGASLMLMSLSLPWPLSIAGI